MNHRFDFLVLGSGIAGLSYALKVAEFGTVGIITKKEQAESNTPAPQLPTIGNFFERRGVRSGNWAERSASRFFC